MLRSFFGFLSAIFFVLSLDYLQMSLTVSLYFTSPIFTAILCYFILGEKLGKFDVISIFSAMIGVLLITFPSIFFEPKQHLSLLQTTNFHLGVAFAILGSISNALVFLVCRVIGNEVHQSLHPFYFAVTTIMGSMVGLGLSG